MKYKLTLVFTFTLPEHLQNSENVTVGDNERIKKSAS